MISNLTNKTDEDSKQALISRQNTDKAFTNSSQAVVLYSDDEQGAYHIEQDDEHEDDENTASGTSI